MVKLQYCILTVIHSRAIMSHVLAAIHPIAPPFVRFFFRVCAHHLSVQLSRSAFQLFTPGIPSLPRKESASISFHGLYTSFVFILLRTLLHCEKRYRHSFQYLPHSLAKTPGWGGTSFKQKGLEFHWQLLGSRFTEHRSQLSSSTRRSSLILFASPSVPVCPRYRGRLPGQGRPFHLRRHVSIVPRRASDGLESA